jgi:hypothetical protein
MTLKEILVSEVPGTVLTLSAWAPARPHDNNGATPDTGQNVTLALAGVTPVPANRLSCLVY